jgi:uncharacterized membrane protein (UPF0127 family)
MKWFVASLVLVTLALIGCGQPATPAAGPAAAVPGIPTRAQARLQTIKLLIGSKEVTAELAVTAEQVQTGMMFRTSMAADDGMLFVFGQPHQASFWMKNTYVPLTTAYIDPEGVIRELHEFHPTNEVSVVAGISDVQYVLEMNRGWFKSNNIAIGTRIATEKGSLRDTFFRPKNK